MTTVNATKNDCDFNRYTAVVCIGTQRDGLCHYVTDICYWGKVISLRKELILQLSLFFLESNQIFWFQIKIYTWLINIIITLRKLPLNYEENAVGRCFENNFSRPQNKFLCVHV